MEFRIQNIKTTIGLISLIFFIIGCDKTENPYLKSEQQKESIVFKAENRSEEYKWEIDSQNFELKLKNWGLDPLFIPLESFGNNKTNFSSLEYCVENSRISALNKPICDSILQLYSDHQNKNISTVNKLIENCNYQIDSFITLQNQRLAGRIIDKKLYDQILTESRETFCELFRQDYYKANIRSSSSIELFNTLTSIENVVSTKEWERLVLNIEN